MTVPTLPGIRYALTSALRNVNAAYLQLPENRRPDVVGEEWTRREAAIDLYCRRGERDAALNAVAAWEDFALSELRGAGK